MEKTRTFFEGRINLDPTWMVSLLLVRINFVDWLVFVLEHLSVVQGVPVVVMRCFLSDYRRCAFEQK